MRKQRVIGFALVFISWIMLIIAATGETLEEQDATAVLFTLPSGLYMMLSNNYILYPDTTGVGEE